MHRIQINNSTFGPWNINEFIIPHSFHRFFWVVFFRRHRENKEVSISINITKDDVIYLVRNPNKKRVEKVSN